MRDFLLSKNTNFSFKLFGIQHIIMLLITLIAFVLIFILKKEIIKIETKKFKVIRIIMALMLFINMFVYRVSYIYYGVYDIRVHLSLYFCHIVNYIFVILLIINRKKFYKLGYVLSWIGSIWGILFPEISQGFDCFIFYSIFISHNLLSIFATFIMCRYEIKIYFLKDIKYFVFAVCIVLFTYVVNYDFGTNFNKPNWDMLMRFNEYLRYVILLILGFIGYIVSYITNKIYIGGKYEEI